MRKPGQLSARRDVLITADVSRTATTISITLGRLRFRVSIFIIGEVRIRFDLDGSSSVAQHVNVIMVDDIDGSEAAETVSFGLDGRRYDIDLSANHAAQLRDALASFVAAARRGAGGSGRRASVPPATQRSSNRERISAIREWAKANGQTVADRGRISKAVMEAYENRNSMAPPEAPEPAKKSSKRSRAAAN